LWVSMSLTVTESPNITPATQNTPPASKIPSHLGVAWFDSSFGP
jgi:hypothetical protein